MILDFAFVNTASDKKHLVTKFWQLNRFEILPNSMNMSIIFSNGWLRVQAGGRGNGLPDMHQEPRLLRHWQLQVSSRTNASFAL